MKKTALICCLAFLVVASCTEKKSPEVTILGMWTDYYLIPNTLKGKVKEMKELNYWAVEKDGKIVKGEPMTSKDLDSIGSTKNFAAYFDNMGTLERYDILDMENVVESHIGTIQNGKCTRWDYKLKDSISYYLIPEYDNLGNLTGASGYRPLVDTLLNRVFMANDGKGNFTKFEYFNSKNIRTGYHLCSLDNEGHIIEAKYFNKADSLSSIMKNSYSSNGSIIQQVTTIEKTKIPTVWDYKDLKLDEHGNVTEYSSIIDNGKFKLFTERIFVYY